MRENSTLCVVYLRAAVCRIEAFIEKRGEKRRNNAPKSTLHSEWTLSPSVTHLPYPHTLSSETALFVMAAVAEDKPLHVCDICSRSFTLVGW